MKLIFCDVKRAFTIFPFIFLPKGCTASIIEHEKAHYKSQEKWSYFVFIWLILYFTSKKFRWREEKKAFKAQFDWLNENNLFNNLSYWKYCMLNQYWKMATIEQIDEFLKPYYNIKK